MNSRKRSLQISSPAWKKRMENTSRSLTEPRQPLCDRAAQEGDVIVLAGKGHEDYQEICGKKYHMDERELVADVVKDGNFLQ